MTARTEPETLVALEEERDFLLRSIEDLEREHDAGDIEDDDYETLKDDYTARAAAVLRAIDGHRATAEKAVGVSKRRAGPGRTVAWIAGVVVFALLAGFLVQQAAGRRSPGQTVTGNSADSVTALLTKANEQVQKDDVDGAIKTYDKVLATDPKNAEALAYQAALFNRKGDSTRALAQLEEAIKADPTFLDAYSFKVLIYANQKRLDNAVAVVHDLAAQGDSDVAVSVVQQVAGSLDPVSVLKLYDGIIEAKPNDALALAYRGWSVATVVLSDKTLPADQRKSLLTEALGYLDRAAKANPKLSDAQAFRTIVLHKLGRDDEARKALAAFDATNPPADMQQIVDSSGLRDELKQK